VASPRRLILSEEMAGAAVMGIVLIIPFVLSFNPYYVSIFISALILGGVSIAWNLLAGGCGQVSFGHAAFFGIGAYASAILVTKGGWSPYYGIVAGGICGALGSLVIGLPAFRLRGPYFALAILGFAEVAKLLTSNLTWLTEGSQGIFDIPPLPALHLGGLTVDFQISRTTNYFVGAALVMAIYMTAYFIRRSNLGLAMSAVHGDEETAAGIGVHVVRTKAFALVVSAFCTAVMGAFYAHYVRFLSPDTAFEGTWSVMPIVASLFGGMRTLIGPMLGSLVIIGVDEFVAKQFFEMGHKLFFGLLLATVIVWAPAGLMGDRVRMSIKGQKR
jgi:branched-chain amino acid transport system permease protein